MSINYSIKFNNAGFDAAEAGTLPAKDAQELQHLIEEHLVNIHARRNDCVDALHEIAKLHQSIAYWQEGIAKNQESIEYSVAVLEEKTIELYHNGRRPIPDGVRVEPETVYVYEDDDAWQWCLDTSHGDMPVVDRARFDKFLAQRGKLPIWCKTDVKYNVVIEVLE